MQNFRFHHSISQKVLDLKVMIEGTNLEFSHHYFVVLSFFVKSLCVNIFLHLKQEKFVKTSPDKLDTKISSHVKWRESG